MTCSGIGYLCFYNPLRHVKQILYKHLQSGQHTRKQSFKNRNFCFWLFVLLFFVFFFTWLDGCFQDSSQCCLWPPQRLAGSWFRGRTRRTHRSRTRTHSPAGKTVYMNRAIIISIYFYVTNSERGRCARSQCNRVKLIMLQLIQLGGGWNMQTILRLTVTWWQEMRLRCTPSNVY